MCDCVQYWTSLKHVLLPAILGINCLFQTVISCLEIMKPALALQVWHGTGNTRRQICVHTYCNLFHTLIERKNLQIEDSTNFQTLQILWIP